MNTEIRLPVETRLIVVAVMLALTGCLPSLPVPVGDPEKSRVDPYITGIWMLEGESEIYIFEPYDKRTWWLTGITIEVDSDSCESVFSAEESRDIASNEVETGRSYEELIAELQQLDGECFDIERHLEGFKIWRTRLGGEWFMTWEPLGGFDADTGFGAHEWMVFRIEKSMPDRLLLWMPDDDHEAWSILDNKENVTRRAVEKVLRKHADEDDFYYEGPMKFRRFLPEHLELIEQYVDIGEM